MNHFSATDSHSPARMKTDFSRRGSSSSSNLKFFEDEEDLTQWREDALCLFVFVVKLNLK